MSSVIDLTDQIPRSFATKALVKDWEAWKSRQPRLGRGKKFIRRSTDKTLQSPQSQSGKRLQATSGDDDEDQASKKRRTKSRKIVESSPETTLQSKSPGAADPQQHIIGSSPGTHSSGITVEVLPTQRHLPKVSIEVNQPCPTPLSIQGKIVEQSPPAGLSVLESLERFEEPSSVAEQAQSVSEPSQETFGPFLTALPDSRRVIPDSQFVGERPGTGNTTPTHLAELSLVELSSAQATIAETYRSPITYSLPHDRDSENQQSPQSTPGHFPGKSEDTGSSISTPPPLEPLEKSQTDTSSGQTSQQQQTQDEPLNNFKNHPPTRFEQQGSLAPVAPSLESLETSYRTQASRQLQILQTEGLLDNRNPDSTVHLAPSSRTPATLTRTVSLPSLHLQAGGTLQKEAEPLHHNKSRIVSGRNPSTRFDSNGGPSDPSSSQSRSQSVQQQPPPNEKHPAAQTDYREHTSYNDSQRDNSEILNIGYSQRVELTPLSRNWTQPSSLPHKQGHSGGVASLESECNLSSVLAPPPDADRRLAMSSSVPLPPRPETPSTMSRSQRPSTAHDSFQSDVSQGLSQRSLSLRERLKMRQEETAQKLLGTPFRSCGVEGVQTTSSLLHGRGVPDYSSRSSSGFVHRNSPSQPNENSSWNQDSEKRLQSDNAVVEKQVNEMISQTSNPSQSIASRTPPNWMLKTNRPSLASDSDGRTASSMAIDFEIALPLKESARKLYIDSFHYHQDLMARLHSGEDMNVTSSGIPPFCDKLRAICLHQDLLNDGNWTQVPVNPVDSLSWAVKCSSKFEFLYALLNRAWCHDRHIAIFAPPGSPMQILETFLQGMDIEHQRSTRPLDEPPIKRLQVSIFETSRKNDNLKPSNVDLVIGLDETFDKSSDSVQAVVNNAAHSDSSPRTVSLAIPYSMEHISRKMPNDLPLRERLFQNTRDAMMLRHRVGILGTEVTSEQLVHDIAGRVFELLNPSSSLDSDAKRNLEDFSLQHLELHSTTASNNAGELGITGKDKRKRSVDSEVASAPDTSAKKPKLSTQIRQAHSSNSTSRVCDSTAAYPVSADAAIETNQAQDSKSLDKLKIEELTLKLQAVQSSESNLQTRNRMLEQSLDSYIPQVASIAKANREMKTEIANLQRQKEKSEAFSATNTTLKQDIKALQSELDGVRLMVKESTVPEQRELEVAREAARRIPVLEKKIQAKQNDYDYIMEQYHKASGHNTELSNTVDDLREENEKLRQKASGEATKLRAAFVKSRDESLEKEHHRLKAHVAEQERFCKHAEMTSRQLREEVKALKEIRGMGASTRASSVRASSVPTERDLPSARRPIGRANGRLSGQGVTAHGKETSELLRKAIAGK